MIDIITHAPFLIDLIMHVAQVCDKTEKYQAGSGCNGHHPTWYLTRRLSILFSPGAGPPSRRLLLHGHRVGVDVTEPLAAVVQRIV